MTKTRKRKIKSIIAELIACTLIAIILVAIVYALIWIMALVTFVIESANTAIVVIISVIAIIMMFLEFREGWEKMDKYNKMYIWHIITKAKMKLKLKELPTSVQTENR